MMLWSTTHRKQQGNALILVVFIIVVVGFVALVANRNQARSSQQLVSMVLGTRAEMAARSAAEIEISRYYQYDAQSSCRVAQS
ncbi:hypothetical protein, partial [Klebsiella pneumoniae]|uniref:hypothetical protein n=1 Tax=Klebsiella pneumoniae TaxID=573 RepID=UPI00190F98C3